jgi:HEPN domain-containing protein
LEKARQEAASTDPAYMLFFLQQAAEKCLKGKLVALGWSLLKTHDLGALLEAAAGHGLALDWFADTAEALTYEYFAERYPGDFEPPPAAEEIRRLLADVDKLLAQLFPEGNA